MIICPRPQCSKFVISLWIFFYSPLCVDQLFGIVKKLMCFLIAWTLHDHPLVIKKKVYNPTYDPASRLQTAEPPPPRRLTVCFKKIAT